MKSMNEMTPRGAKRAAECRKRNKSMKEIELICGAAMWAPPGQGNLTSISFIKTKETFIFIS